MSTTRQVYHQFLVKTSCFGERHEIGYFLSNNEQINNKNIAVMLTSMSKRRVDSFLRLDLRVRQSIGDTGQYTADGLCALINS